MVVCLLKNIYLYTLCECVFSFRSQCSDEGRLTLPEFPQDLAGLNENLLPQRHANKIHILMISLFLSTLTIGRSSLCVSRLAGLDSVVSFHHKNNVFYSWVKSNPVKLKTSILPPTVIQSNIFSRPIIATNQLVPRLHHFKVVLRGASDVKLFQHLLVLRLFNTGGRVVARVKVIQVLDERNFEAKKWTEVWKSLLLRSLYFYPMHYALKWFYFKRIIWEPLRYLWIRVTTYSASAMKIITTLTYCRFCS